MLLFTHLLNYKAVQRTEPALELLCQNGTLMYTKWLLTCWLALSFYAHGEAQSPSPLAIQVEDCQTLTVSLNTTASAKGNTLLFTLILERALATDLWQKVKTVPSAVEQHTFRDLPFARYRVRLVDQVPNGLAFSRSSAEDQKGYLLSKVVTLSAANCNSDRSAARTLPSIGSALHVYPNPARDFLQVQISNETSGQWRIFDLQGRSLAHGALVEGNLRIELGNFKPGVYFLRLHTEKGEVFQQKFVKR